jgi:hypothetical protein
VLELAFSVAVFWSVQVLEDIVFEVGLIFGGCGFCRVSVWMAS